MSTGASTGPGGRLFLPDWRTANVRASWLLATATVLVVAGVGYLVALALDPALAIPVVALSVFIAGGQSLIAYRFGDRLALAATAARPATPDEERYLLHVSEAVSIGAGIPMPRVFVIDSPAPNAFATGRNPETSSIAVTRGLLDVLDRQELEGVVAHEIAHVRNLDIRFMTMLAATVGAVVILRDVLLRALRYGGGGRRGRSGKNGGQGVMLVLLVVVLVLAPLLLTLLRMAASRRREFLADATAASITRNPEGLARALEKLRDYQGKKLEVSAGVEHLFFVNPKRNLNAATLFSTHPPIEERIDRLRRL